LPATAPGASLDSPVLDEPEADRQALMLAELQAALTALDVNTVLARRHRLVLRYSDPPPLAPSGPTSPTLHIFAPDGTRTATADGSVYQLDDGRTFPISDPATAAAAICGPPARARPAIATRLTPARARPRNRRLGAGLTVMPAPRKEPTSR
jgi:hypothetical protein